MTQAATASQHGVQSHPLGTTAPACQRGQEGRPPLRLGFLGVGWIGRHRMEALLNAGEVCAAVLADPNPEVLRESAELAPEAARTGSIEALLEHDLDGVVIATPSALHAQQTIAALRRGMAVFCQKPLARTAAEARAIVATAREADRLLGIDLSYRYTAAYSAVAELIRSGQLGDLFAVDFTFHNAYGPDKPWFRDPALSGGGCMIDLGVHLIDLALLSLDWPHIDRVCSDLYAGGVPIRDVGAHIEDYATADLRATDGRSIRIACSWNLHAGQDALIRFEFHGSRAGAVIQNIGGSFYDFIAECFHGTSRHSLIGAPAHPDDWGGRAAVAWARRLALTPSFDPDAMRAIEVASVIDRIYGR